MILKDSHFIDCSNATKSGLVDLLQANATIISGVLIFLILAPISKGIAARIWERKAVLGTICGTLLMLMLTMSTGAIYIR
jgi:hypothetical protein